VRRAIELLWMSLRESFVPGEIERIPEHLLVMDDGEQVNAWHAHGDGDGPIAPAYHLNALACSRLAPRDATIVDLGCGSGRFAAYLARLRPDVRIIGFDLSEPMVELGNAALAKAGLAARVTLRIGDMTSFSAQLELAPDLIACVFALHHLPSLEHVQDCLREVHGQCETSGASFWLFDLARPRHAGTVRDYPRLITPGAREVFQADARNSLMAAFSHAELQREIARVFGSASVEAACARALPLYQAFWYEGPGRRLGVSSRKELREKGAHVELSPRNRTQFFQLRSLLPQLPS